MNQALLPFINLIIKNYFRMLFLVSLISKTIFPNSVQSYIASFLKSTGISKIVFETLSINLSVIYFVFYLILQLLEVSILYYSFVQEKIFEKLITLTITFFLCISVFAYMFNIPGDCGCFGEVIEFSNNIYKVIFNLVNLIIVVTYIVINKKIKRTH